MPIRKKFKLALEDHWRVAFNTASGVLFAALFITLMLLATQAVESYQLQWSNLGRIVLWSLLPSLSFALPFAWICFYAVLGQGIKESHIDKSIELSGLSPLRQLWFVHLPALFILPFLLLLFHFGSPHGKQAAKRALPNAIMNLDFDHATLQDVALMVKADQLGGLKLYAIQDDVAYVFNDVSISKDQHFSFTSGVILPRSEDWSFRMGSGSAAWTARPMKIEIDERDTPDLIRSIGRWQKKGERLVKPQQELIKRSAHPLGVILLGGLAFLMGLRGWHAALTSPVLFLGWWGMIRIADSWVNVPAFSAFFPVLVFCLLIPSFWKKRQ